MHARLCRKLQDQNDSVQQCAQLLLGGDTLSFLLFAHWLGSCISSFSGDSSIRSCYSDGSNCQLVFSAFLAEQLALYTSSCKVALIKTI